MGNGFARFLKLIVHNEAMRNDPPEIYNWRVFALACAGHFGGMLFGWDIGAIGGVLTYPNFMTDYGINKDDSSTLNENIVSTLQAGCFVACLAASPIADRWGRRWSLIISGLITCVGVAMQAGSNHSLAVMYTGRLVAGLGVGAASMLTPLYVSECAPRAIRGGLTGFYQLFIVIGTMISFWINYASLTQGNLGGVYQLPLGLQAIPAICLAIGMFLRSSPRWCARKDYWERTHAILTRLSNLPGDHPYIQGEIQEMSAQLEMERRLMGDATSWVLLREMWTIPGNRKRALISIGLMVCQQMTGVNAINYYAPQIFQSMGMDGAQSSLFATGVYGIVKTVTCFCFLVFAADSLGRRRSLLWTSIAQSISMYLVGIYIRIFPPVAGAPIPPFGYFAMACIYLFVAFFQFGWGPCCWIYVSEIPTARLRSLNVAIAAATQWLFNFVVARTVLTMMKTMGYKGYGTFFLFGSFCASMFFFAYFFIPETKGMSLEKMDELFGITEGFVKTDDDPEKHSNGQNGTQRAL
ncbi:quinate permease [Thozetella sp. PMI_491]|nr:quinate permease [Thozetella sp. PMI_491]